MEFYCSVKSVSIFCIGTMTNEKSRPADKKYKQWRLYPGTPHCSLEWLSRMRTRGSLARADMTWVDVSQFRVKWSNKKKHTLNEELRASFASWNRMLSVVVRKAPHWLRRSKATRRSSQWVEEIASTGKCTSTPCSSDHTMSNTKDKKCCKSRGA